MFTCIVPLSLITTYPALALLGRVGVGQVATSLGVALAFLLSARWYGSDQSGRTRGRAAKVGWPAK